MASKRKAPAKKAPAKGRKPKKRAPKTKAQRQAAQAMGKANATVDWDRGKALYIENGPATYETVAEALGVYPSTVRRKGAEGGWAEEKAQYQADLMRQGLRQALEDQKAGAAAILKLQYNEAIDHASQLQQLRRQQGTHWKPSEHRAYATAWDLVIRNARMAVGLPSEITPDSAAAQDLPHAYIPGQGVAPQAPDEDKDGSDP